MFRKKSVVQRRTNISFEGVSDFNDLDSRLQHSSTKKQLESLKRLLTDIRKCRKHISLPVAAICSSLCSHILTADDGAVRAFGYEIIHFLYEHYDIRSWNDVKSALIGELSSPESHIAVNSAIGLLFSLDGPTLALFVSSKEFAACLKVLTTSDKLNYSIYAENLSLCLLRAFKFMESDAVLIEFEGYYKLERKGVDERDTNLYSHSEFLRHREDFHDTLIGFYTVSVKHILSSPVTGLDDSLAKYNSHISIIRTLVKSIYCNSTMMIDSWKEKVTGSQYNSKIKRSDYFTLLPIIRKVILLFCEDMRQLLSIYRSEISSVAFLETIGFCMLIILDGFNVDATTLITTFDGQSVMDKNGRMVNKMNIYLDIHEYTDMYLSIYCSVLHIASLNELCTASRLISSVIVHPSLRSLSSIYSCKVLSIISSFLKHSLDQNLSSMEDANTKLLDILASALLLFRFINDNDLNSSFHSLYWIISKLKCLSFETVLGLMTDLSGAIVKSSFASQNNAIRNSVIVIGLIQNVFGTKKIQLDSIQLHKMFASCVIVTVSRQFHQNLKNLQNFSNETSIDRLKDTLIDSHKLIDIIKFILLSFDICLTKPVDTDIFITAYVNLLDYLTMIFFVGDHKKSLLMTHLDRIESIIANHQQSNALSSIQAIEAINSIRSSELEKNLVFIIRDLFISKVLITNHAPNVVIYNILAIFIGHLESLLDSMGVGDNETVRDMQPIRIVIEYLKESLQHNKYQSDLLNILKIESYSSTQATESKYILDVYDDAYSYVENTLQFDLLIALFRKTAKIMKSVSGNQNSFEILVKTNISAILECYQYLNSVSYSSSSMHLDDCSFKLCTCLREIGFDVDMPGSLQDFLSKPLKFSDTNQSLDLDMLSTLIDNSTSQTNLPNATVLSLQQSSIISIALFGLDISDAIKNNIQTLILIETIASNQEPIGRSENALLIADEYQFSEEFVNLFTLDPSKPWQSISGSSDPMSVFVYQEINPSTYVLTLFIRIYNCCGFRIPSFRIHGLFNQQNIAKPPLRKINELYQQSFEPFIDEIMNLQANSFIDRTMSFQLNQFSSVSLSVRLLFDIDDDINEVFPNNRSTSLSATSQSQSIIQVPRNESFASQIAANDQNGSISSLIQKTLTLSMRPFQVPILHYLRPYTRSNSQSSKLFDISWNQLQYSLQINVIAVLEFPRDHRQSIEKKHLMSSRLRRTIEANAEYSLSESDSYIVLNSLVDEQCANLSNRNLFSLSWHFRTLWNDELCITTTLFQDYEYNNNNHAFRGLMEFRSSQQAVVEEIFHSGIDPLLHSLSAGVVSVDKLESSIFPSSYEEKTMVHDLWCQELIV